MVALTHFIQEVLAVMSFTKARLSVVTLLLVLAGTAAPAAASVFLSGPYLPASIPNPTGGFNITYSLGGSQSGVGAATAEVAFYLSTKPNGSSGVGFLTSRLVHLSGSGSGPYYPPSGTQTQYISPINLSASARAMLQSIADACQPQSLYLLAQVNGGFYKYAPTVMGTIKPADFMFTAGTISSSVIQPGGTTNLSFSLYSRCAASTASRVGIFLADTALNPLAFIGAVSISAGAGTSSLPPTPITFSPYISPGSYRILIVADVDSIVAESHESNNAGYFDLTVVSAAAPARSQPPGQLQPATDLREDLAPELEDLERDPPEDYVSPLDAAITRARP
jgi:hypothetical protein